MKKNLALLAILSFIACKNDEPKDKDSLQYYYQVEDSYIRNNFV